MLVNWFYRYKKDFFPLSVAIGRDICYNESGSRTVSMVRLDRF